MKKLLILALSLFSLQVTAAERSMTIFANPYQMGSYKDILGEAQINEVNHSTPEIDLLLPVGTANASSVEVLNGYCSLLASGDFFSGSWMTLKPGRYDTLGALDNLTRSLLTYKMIGSGQLECNPKQDIPMLYDAAGIAFPLSSLGNPNNSYPLQVGLPTSDPSPSTEKHVVRYIRNSDFPLDPTKLYNLTYQTGGFSHRAVSLNVPSCYEVTLSGGKDDGTYYTYVSQVFSAGNYNLANYNLDNSADKATTTRLVNCTQPPINTFTNFLLQHAGGSCIHPLGGSPTPNLSTHTVLYPLCDATEARLAFRSLPNGSLSHNSSDMCLHPEGGSPNPVSGTRLVFWPLCSDGVAADADGNKRLAFEFTAAGSIRHKNSGLCVHPIDDSANPGVETELVLASGCDTPNLNFTRIRRIPLLIM